MRKVLQVCATSITSDLNKNLADGSEILGQIGSEFEETWIFVDLET